MKIIVIVILLVLLGVLVNELYFFYEKNRAAESRYQEFKTQLDKASLAYKQLREDLDYYLNPANLEKELRSRFNYRLPDEKFLIIVPGISPTSSSSSR